MNKSSNVSIVIPTRNRLSSLNRTLISIHNQTWHPREIIIVDSSDIPLTKEDLTVVFENLVFLIVHSKPSVCLQRNIGIGKSNSEYVLLCDDDIEISKNYIEELTSYLEINPSETIASGLVFEKYNDKWEYSASKNSTLGLIFAYIFSLPLNFKLDRKAYPNNFFIQKIVDFFYTKGNSIAKSGWPRTIDYSGTAFKTPIYGLGVSLIRANNLKQVLYDTAFYNHGVGDNYDLAIGLSSGVNVVTNAKAYHHKETANRIGNDKAYYYRICALHYIMLKHERFTYKNLLFLIWSLIGNSILFLVKGKFKRIYYNVMVIFRIIFNRSLYKRR